MIAALAIVAAIAAEALAVYTGAELFAAAYREDQQQAVTAVAFVAVALVAYGLPRAVGELGLTGRRASIVLAAVTYLALYGAMRIEFAGDLALWNWSWVVGFIDDAETTTRESGPALIGGALLIGIWVRSSWRSYQQVDGESIARTIGVPFAVVTVFVILGAATDRTGVIARGAVSFYVVAVLALALSQSALSGATIGTLRAGSVTATLLAGTAAVTVVCVVVFTIVFGILGDQFGELVGDILNTILIVIFTPIAWILEKLISLLLPGSPGLPEVQLPDPITQVEAEPGEADGRASRPFLVAGRMIVLFAAILAGVAIVTFFTRLRAAGRNARREIVHRSGAGSLGADLAAGFRALFSRSSQGYAPPPSSPAVRLYREVLERAERTGRPRAPGETPREFAPALHGLFHTPVTDEITMAFQEARYAGREPDPALLAELERRWRSTELE